MHVMIDLETMGTRPNAPIIAIGAVAFSAHGLGYDLYRVVPLADSVKHGAVIDPNTVMWWMQQGDEARSALIPKKLDQDDPKYIEYSPDLQHALESVTRFLKTLSPIKGVWGNGATFDNVILRETYTRFCMECPWPFWMDKCYRTVKGAYPNIELDRSGTHHNALADARSQAEHLIRINEAAGGVFL